MTDEERKILERRILLKKQLVELTLETIKEMEEMLNEDGGSQRSNRRGGTVY